MFNAVRIEEFGLDGLTKTELSRERLGPGEVRLRMRAVSLNYRDYLMALGRYNPRLPLPIIACSDGAGEVLAVGSEVTSVKQGDRVVTVMIPDWEDGDPVFGVHKTTLGGPADGVLCEERVLPERAVLKCPDGLSFREAACLPVAGLTAWNALVNVGQTGPGSKVLLLGTGGVSMMALDLAKRLGAETAITSGSDEKLARAKALGADHGVNYRTRADWAANVLEIFPQGVDCVLEVGGDGTFDQSVKAVRMGGRVALIGVLAARGAAVNLTAVLMKSVRVQGVLVGSRADFRRYLAFIEESGFEAPIDRVFQGLDEARAAFDYLASGRHFGKIVIEIG